MIAGSSVPLRGRLLLADGAPVAQATVSIWATLSKKKIVHRVKTDATGAFATTYSLPHNVTFSVSFAGSGAIDDTTAKVSYHRVAPRWKYRHTKTKVTVTNYSRYGQKLSLQKKSGSKWKTVKSIKVTKKTWSVTAKQGTWRLLSHANSNLASRTSASWKN